MYTYIIHVYLLFHYHFKFILFILDRIVMYRITRKEEFVMILSFMIIAVMYRN